MRDLFLERNGPKAVALVTGAGGRIGQFSIPLLRASGRDRTGEASVVNIASAAGLRGVAFHIAYCASNGAVTLLTKSAAKEFTALKYPVRINSIHPSGVETPMTESIFARYVIGGGLIC